MLKQLKKIVRMEIRMLFWGKRPLALVFTVPLLFCFLFGAVYMENTVRHISMIVYDEDQSSTSRALIQAYDDSERYHVVAYADNQEKLEEKLADGTAKVGISIPKNFSKDIKLGTSTTILMFFNSSNNIFANSAMTFSQEIDRTVSLGVAKKLVEGTNMLPDEAMDMVYPIHLGVRILNNPTVGYTSFMLPGIMLNGVQISLLLSVAPLLASICRHKRYDKSYSSAVLMIGKAIPYWGMGMISYGISLLVLHYVWAIPFRGSIKDIFLLGGAFIFCVIAVLYVFSAICPDEAFAMQLPLIYIMPGLLFSGLSWPTFSMQRFSKLYSASMPLTYAGDTMRDLMLEGYAPFLLHDVSCLLLGGVGAGIVAWSIFALRRFIGFKKRGGTE